MAAVLIFAVLMLISPFFSSCVSEAEKESPGVYILFNMFPNLLHHQLQHAFWQTRLAVARLDYWL